MKVLDKAVSLKLSQVRIIISQLGLTPSVQPISYICYDWLCIYLWFISKKDHLCGVMNTQLFYKSDDGEEAMQFERPLQESVPTSTKRAN
jgi:hypothetical protein